MKRFLPAILALVCVVALYAVARAIPITTQYFGVVEMSALTADVNSLSVPATGTPVTGIRFGTLSVATGATTGTLTLAGVTSSSKVIATVQGGNASGVFIETAVPGTNQVAVTLSGTPGATTTITVLALN
jgi:hypothetical protein